MTSPDVVVIGGGIMGTSAAWELARAGAAVTVLEKAIPGAEASSAAAGILGAEIEALGRGPMLELSRKSRQLYPSWVARLQKTTGVSVGYLEGGSLQLVFDAKQAKTFRSERKWQIDEGACQPLSRRATRSLESNLNADAYAGLHYPGDARIEPALLFRATHIAAVQAGVTFRSGATVRRVLTEKTPPTGKLRATAVELEGGETLRAGHIVIAAGSWTPQVGGLPILHQDIVPARGQLVEVGLPVPPLQRLVFGEGCYLIPRADGRVVIGSTLEFVGFRRGVTAGAVAKLLASAQKLVPVLAEAELLRTWSNFRPYTADHLPLIGRAGVDGLVIASGHYRTGILLTPITARIVARLVQNKRPPLALEAFDPLRQPGARGSANARAAGKQLQSVPH